jgi:hypothetical protein
LRFGGVGLVDTVEDVDQVLELEDEVLEVATHP